VQKGMSASPQKADMCSANWRIALSPKATQTPSLKQFCSALALDIDLLRYSEGIVYVDAQIPDSALYFGMTE